MALLSAGRQIGQTIKSAPRFRTIVSVFASHGFQNIIERIQLGSSVLSKIFPTPEAESLSAPVRLRMAFEQLGPTFIKLGQLLATRPDLIPEEFVQEFKKLHDKVRPVEFANVRQALADQFGTLESVFRFFNETPMASASIAQVHRAGLLDGTEVVVKIRRPGIVEIIEDDLIILYNLAGLLEKYVPETRVFSPHAIVDEFFKTLELETNFVVEANNIQRIAKNFANHPQIKIPKVYLQYSGPQVLVMEAINGTPLSQEEALRAHHIDREAIVRLGLRAFFKMVFQDRFFHGDLHAGNIFLLPDNRIGVVDFGVVGRISERVRDVIADMLVYLAHEDYESFAYSFVEIAPYHSGVDVDKFARDLRDLIAPYFGLSFRNVNMGKLLMDSTRIAAKHHLAVPSELMLFFKAIVTVEGMGRIIIEDFDVLNYSLEFAQEIVKGKYDPDRMVRDLLLLAKESSSLVYSLPRQAKQLLRKLNSDEHAWKMEIPQLDDLKRAIETSSNILFLGLIIGSLILSATVALFLEKASGGGGWPLVATLSYTLAALLGMVGFYNYIKK